MAGSVPGNEGEGDRHRHLPGGSLVGGQIELLPIEIVPGFQNLGFGWIPMRGCIQRKYSALPGWSGQPDVL